MSLPQPDLLNATSYTLRNGQAGHLAGTRSGMGCLRTYGTAVYISFGTPTLHYLPHSDSAPVYAIGTDFRDGDL